MQVNNFDVSVIDAKEENKVFTVERGKPYVLRINNNNDKRAVCKVFVNNELASPEGILLPAKNFLDVPNPKFIGGDKHKVRLELYFEIQIAGHFNIDVNIPWGPWRPHPYYPPPYYPPPYPYYPPPAPYYPPPYYPQPQPQPEPDHHHCMTMAVPYENNATVIEFDVVGN